MERKQALPEYLKQLRKSHHYRQEDIALQLNISRQTYSHYETGRIRPTVSKLYKLARLYGISVDEILEHMEIASQEPDTEPEKKGHAVSEKEFVSCLNVLDEKDRDDILSIMWEIMQARILKQRTDMVEK